MFDTEDSDSSVDDKTLAWIDQYPVLELSARTFGYLHAGAVATVPPCITGENDVAAHAKELLSKVLRTCLREDVDLIQNVHDARDLIERKHLILEQAERLESVRSEERRIERERSERVRNQGRDRSDRDRSDYMAGYN